MKILSLTSLSIGLIGQSIQYVILCLFCWALSPAVNAEDLADINIEIGIVTYGPGADMMSRFGHSAIALVHPNGDKEFYELAASHEGNRDSIIPWYLTPEPLIYIARQKSRVSALNNAFLSNRSVDIRLLDLTDSQKRHFAQLLADSISEDNALFEFGLYTRNCTTRTRDIIDTVLEGRLHNQFKHLPVGMSYRQHTQRSFEYNWPLRIAADLVTGRLADNTHNFWEESFLPSHFAKLLDQSLVINHEGNIKPLVKEHYLLFEGSQEGLPMEVPFFIDPWFWMLGILLAFGIYLLVSNNRSITLKLMTYSWLVFTGSIGALLCYLWFIGNEPVASWNENILLFNPLALVIALTKQIKWKIYCTWLWLFMLILAIVLKWLPGSQSNMAWIGLTLPIHLVLIHQLLLNTLPENNTLPMKFYSRNAIKESF